jgi:hypothetical protein
MDEKRFEENDSRNESEKHDNIPLDPESVLEMMSAALRVVYASK